VISLLLQISLWLAAIAPVETAAVEVSIPAVQGRTHLSPYLGKVVRVRGVVTAVAGGEVYLQDAQGDGDPATSDAIILRTTAQGLARQDVLSAAGQVVEHVPGGAATGNLSVTAIETARVQVIQRGSRLPPPLILGRAGRLPASGHVISPDELPVNLRDREQVQRNRYDPESDAIDFYESLEGMLVTLPLPIAVSATHRFSPKQSEIVVLPDNGQGVPAHRRTWSGGILLQSGSNNLAGQNPERVQIQLQTALFPEAVPLVGVGDSLGDVTGVVRYSFGSYEVAATQAFPVRPRRAAPETTLLRGTPAALSVASYNVLNLSPTASDTAQHRLLASQMVQALRSPDIIALQEIQDESGEADDGTTSARGTLAALTAAIVAAGGPRYESFDVAPADGRPGGVPGGNIRNAFLFKPDRVRLVASRSLTPAVLSSARVQDTLAFQDSRDPLEGVFEFRGRPLRVVNNHLTSRFGSTPVFGAVQPFLQAGERERGAQVRALRDYVAQHLSANPAARIVVLGDMNTFEFSDELARVLPGSPPVLYSLMRRVPGPERYSYNYEGNSQLLDHAFVSQALTEAEIDLVHLNTDFPARPGLTASDHDPLVVLLR
jgi:predicted extracellular nuclease